MLAAVGTTARRLRARTRSTSPSTASRSAAPAGVGEDRALVDLAAREVHVVVDLHAGDADATVWTNDLTHDYVHENSAYCT